MDATAGVCVVPRCACGYPKQVRSCDMVPFGRGMRIFVAAGIGHPASRSTQNAK